ncbi:hypothetical protein [Rhizobium rhizogenes]|uniref:hypothetical protein n=1 Tax=Rhizobium rhizogenes TaxID=359 RepID=UPI0015734503|nr:hypothetical protein [Rhizobium rhizogenes]NTF65780.1 hypothetical protein [Rhizobium rhizogenes]NTG97133.1 hypothetical protein [Rhizobium rhizogenes]
MARRVSTKDRTVAAQLAELRKAECVRIFEETASGAKAAEVGAGRLDGRKGALG